MESDFNIWSDSSLIKRKNNNNLFLAFQLTSLHVVGWGGDEGDIGDVDIFVKLSPNCNYFVLSDKDTSLTQQDILFDAYRMITKVVGSI